MGHIFISYNRKDQSTARRLADDLRHHGYDVWMDDRIEYGGQWLNVIFEAIRDASAVVIVMSPDSEKSKWVQKEYLYAEELEKLIIPIALNGHIFPYLKDKQASDPSQTGGLTNRAYRQLEAVVTPLDQTGQMMVLPVSEAKPRPVEQKRKWWAGVLVGVIALAAVLMIIILPNEDDKQSGNSATPTDPPAPTPSPTAEPIEEIAFVMDGEIYLMNTDGSGHRNLTNNPTTHDSEPTWSPDGLQMAFTSYRDDNAEIYIMAADGTGQSNLTQFLADDVNPAWSPDGQTIAFYSERYQNYKIYGIGPDGSYLHRITEGGGTTSSPSWSPDSKTIAFFSTRDGILDIYTMNVDGTALQRLTKTPDEYEYGVAWSPDGTAIAFSLYLSDGNFDIFLMAPDGSNLRNITNTPNTSERDPAWSPDGTRIVFSSTPASRGYVYADIYIMDADGSNLRNITNTPGISEYSPAWRPRVR